MRTLKKDLVSKIAYLIGVREDLLESHYADDSKEILDNIAKQNEARIIRILCTIRSTMMNKYTYINQQIRYNMKNIDSIECFNQDDIKWLQNQGISIIQVNTTIDKYLIKVNKLISEYINQCKHLFPEWANWEYIKDLFVIPGCMGGNEETVLMILKAESKKYTSHFSSYPFTMYIHWNPDNYGNFLATDRKFLMLLYRMHGSEFYDNSKVMDAADDVKETIYDFINRNESTAIIVDCENSNVYKLYSVLTNLDEEETCKIKKIILYDDVHTVKTWKLLEKLINIKVEHITVERIINRKSLVDMKMSVETCKEFYENDIKSFILVSSDSDFWPLISSLPKAEFLVMIEYESCGEDIKRALKQNGTYYCAIDDFCRGNIDNFKILALKTELRERIDKFNNTGIWSIMDCNEFVDDIYSTCRIEATSTERKNFIDRYIKTLSFKINDEGKFFVTNSF